MKSFTLERLLRQHHPLAGLKMDYYTTEEYTMDKLQEDVSKMLEAIVLIKDALLKIMVRLEPEQESSETESSGEDEEEEESESEETDMDTEDENEDTSDEEPQARRRK
jgi:hypothetical protein